jgi:GNAT superfamily N-acetyltransferase
MKRTGKTDSNSIRIVALSPSRWADLEKLFGPRGACAGCWCMYWRLPLSQFKKQQGAANKRAFKKIVASGGTPGHIAYAGREPVGWCAVAPRGTYVKLQNSRTLAPVDDQPVWSVVCFYVAKGYRRRGVTVSLLRAAVEHARKRGARIVEGYPISPNSGRTPDVFAWTGLESAFLKAGFKEVARRSATRPIMRFSISRTA